MIHRPWPFPAIVLDDKEPLSEKQEAMLKGDMRAMAEEFSDREKEIMKTAGISDTLLLIIGTVLLIHCRQWKRKDLANQSLDLTRKGAQSVEAEFDSRAGQA